MPDRPHRGEGTTNPQRKGARYVGQPALGVGSTNPARAGATATATGTPRAVYDSSGALSTQSDMKVPPGATLAVIRVLGPGGGAHGSSTSAPNNSGGYTYHFKNPGASGGAFAKRTVSCSTGDVLSQVSSNGSSTGLGVAQNGKLVAYADGGRNSSQDTSVGGGTAALSVGDVTRSGGAGACSTCGDGGPGDHGALGTAGGSYYYPVGAAASTPDDSYDANGGSGGSAGDYGDADGVGFGWNPATGLQAKGALPARITIHFY